MKGSAIPIKTVGLGLIASCGILTFMSGTKGKRIITPIQVFYHTNIVGVLAVKSMNYLLVLENLNFPSKRMIEHYKKCTGLTEKKIREVLLPAEDVWLSAQRSS